MVFEHTEFERDPARERTISVHSQNAMARAIIMGKQEEAT